MALKDRIRRMEREAWVDGPENYIYVLVTLCNGYPIHLLVSTPDGPVMFYDKESFLAWAQGKDVPAARAAGIVEQMGWLNTGGGAPKDISVDYDDDA